MKIIEAKEVYMLLFFVGLIILFGGGYLYSGYVQKQLEISDNPTPAVKKADGIDFVVMPRWKNWLVNLLNIAGTGPILGPIQGILFGPIAFLAIPIGCVLAGATHDFVMGTISMRNGGAQMPRVIGKYIGNNIRKIYNIVMGVLLLLVGAVFVYTPGDLIANDILNIDPASNQVFIIYAIIFLYYLLSTVLPIDQLIGRIYPIFGAFLIISAVGIFIGLFMNGNLQHLSMPNQSGLLYEHPTGQKFIPAFFVTVACGILSGFHATQSTLISRTIGSERENRQVFYSGMICEGFIAMIWAAGAMVLFSQNTALDTPATLMVGEVSRYFMGKVGGVIAVIGVIALPITTGDTAFRSLRLIVAEELNLDQKAAGKRLGLSVLLFIPAILLLVWAKSDANGFNMIWRYFGFMNQLVGIFALAAATSYLMNKGKNYLIVFIPGLFYTFIVSSFILYDPKVGFGVSYPIALIIGLVLTAAYGYGTLHASKKNKDRIAHIILE